MAEVKNRVWVIVANATHAQVYLSPDLSLRELIPVQEFTNVEGRMHNRDARNFNYGRVQSRSYSRTKGLRPKSTPHDVIRMTFARTLAEYLERGRVNNDFEKLMIVATPKFLGEIRNGLTKQTKTMLWNEIPKELGMDTQKELIEYFEQI